MKTIATATVSLLLIYSSNASAEECGLTFSDANIPAIADTIAGKALDEHKDEFVHPTPIKNRKMPWTLSEQGDMREFIEDILRNMKKATRDGQTKLAIESKDMSSDRIAWWEESTGTYVVYNPNKEDCGTAFRPDDGKDYYDDDE